MKDGQRTGEAELTGEWKIKPKYKNSDQNNTPDCAIKYRKKGINKHNKTQKLLH